MQPNETRYRVVLSSIGLSMLVLLLLLNLGSFAYAAVDALAYMILPDTALAETVSQLFYAASYLVSFLLPIPILRGILRARQVPYAPIRVAPRLSRYLPLMIFGGISLILVQAYLNSFLVGLFDYSIDEYVTITSGTAPYQVVLQFITVCLVPGFVEELLFRGAVQTNCRVFGRLPAILISATFFSLMHQNVEQILYTFAAGILLGLVYEYTGSIWNGVILHVANNFFSVLMSVLYQQLSGPLGATVCLLIEIGLVLLGSISIAYLVFRFFCRRPTVREGFFEKELPASDRFAVCPVAARRMLRLSLSPSVVIFVVFSVLQMILLILLSSFGYAIV